MLPPSRGLVPSCQEQETSMQDPLNASYPVLPLRDIVVFPHMIVPLFVGATNPCARWKR
jgi:ATP-dependent Lon protease